MHSSPIRRGTSTKCHTLPTCSKAFQNCEITRRWKISSQLRTRLFLNRSLMMSFPMCFLLPITRKMWISTTLFLHNDLYPSCSLMNCFLLMFVFCAKWQVTNDKCQIWTNEIVRKRKSTLYCNQNCFTFQNRICFLIFFP